MQPVIEANGGDTPLWWCGAYRWIYKHQRWAKGYLNNSRAAWRGDTVRLLARAAEVETHGT